MSRFRDGFENESLREPHAHLAVDDALEQVAFGLGCPVTELAKTRFAEPAGSRTACFGHGAEGFCDIGEAERGGRPRARSRRGYPPHVEHPSVGDREGAAAQIGHGTGQVLGGKAAQVLGDEPALLQPAGARRHLRAQCRELGEERHGQRTTRTSLRQVDCPGREISR